jgi:hypothetical protein
LLDEYRRLYPIKDTDRSQYDIKYNNLALEHKLIGWSEFFNQSNEVKKWKKDIRNDANKIFNITYNTIKESKGPIHSVKEIESISFEISQKLKAFSVPYVKGLAKFS